MHEPFSFFSLRLKKKQIIKLFKEKKRKTCIPLFISRIGLEAPQSSLKHSHKKTQTCMIGFFENTMRERYGFVAKLQWHVRLSVKSKTKEKSLMVYEVRMYC